MLKEIFEAVHRIQDRSTNVHLFEEQIFYIFIYRTLINIDFYTHCYSYMYHIISLVRASFSRNFIFCLILTLKLMGFVYNLNKICYVRWNQSEYLLSLFLINLNY